VKINKKTRAATVKYYAILGCKRECFDFKVSFDGNGTMLSADLYLLYALQNSEI